MPQTHPPVPFPLEWPNDTGLGVAQIKVKDVYLRVRTYDFCSRAVEAERIALALTKLSTDKLAAAEAAYGVFAAAGSPAAAPAAPPSPMVAGMITLVADSSSLEVRHTLHTALPSYSRRASVQANDRFRRKFPSGHVAQPRSFRRSF